MSSKEPSKDALKSGKTKKLNDGSRPSSTIEESSKSTVKSPALTKSKKYKLMQLSSMLDNNSAPRRKPTTKSDPGSPSTLMDVNVSAVKAKSSKIISKTGSGQQKSDESTSAKSKSKSKSKSSTTAKKPPRTPNVRAPAHRSKLIAGARTVAERQKTVKCGMMMWHFRQVMISTSWTTAVIAFIALIIILLIYILFESDHDLTDCRIIRCTGTSVTWNDPIGRSELHYVRAKHGKFEFYTQIGIDDNEPCRRRSNGTEVTLRGVCRFDECVHMSHREHPGDQQMFKSHTNGKTLRLPSFKYFCLHPSLAVSNNHLLSIEYCPADENSCNGTVQFYLQTSICNRADKIIEKELRKTDCWGHPNEESSFLQKMHDPNSNPPILTFTCNSCKKRWNVVKNSLNCQNQTDTANQCGRHGARNDLLDGNPCCLHGGSAIGRCYDALCWPAF